MERRRENRGGPLIQLAAALVVAALLVNGCATQTLWEPQTYHPSDRPELKLLSVHERTRDLLVEYKEQRAEQKKVQPRAYWLFASDSIRRAGARFRRSSGVVPGASDAHLYTPKP